MPGTSSKRSASVAREGIGDPGRPLGLALPFGRRPGRGDPEGEVDGGLLTDVADPERGEDPRQWPAA